jgi:hypothetical protein
VPIGGGGGGAQVITPYYGASGAVRIEW